MGSGGDSNVAARRFGATGPQYCFSRKPCPTLRRAPLQPLLTVIHSSIVAARRRLPPVWLTAAALLTAGLAPPAYADLSGLYVGASGGDTLSTYRHADIDSAVVGSFAQGGESLVLSSSRVRDDHAPWSVDVGYRFSAYLGLEAAYLQLGTVNYAGSGKASSFFGSAPIDLGLSFKSRGPALALVGVLPMTNAWDLDVRLGGYEGKTLTQYVSSSPSSGFDSKTSSSLMGGVGTQYIIAAHWVLRLDYTHLNSLGEKLLNRSFNVDLLAAGVDYVF